VKFFRTRSANKKGGAYVRTQLKSLGFDDTFIDKIFLQWGIKGDLARALLPNVGVGFKKTFNASDFTQELPITISSRAGKTFAQSAEEMVIELFEKSGMKRLESKIGSDNGFDILLVDNISKPKQVIIIEVKSSISTTHSAPMGSPVKACKDPQMSLCWLTDVVDRMMRIGSTTVEANGKKIEGIVKSGKAERYVVSAISPSGRAKILKIN
jgi:hypothetical protein